MRRLFFVVVLGLILSTFGSAAASLSDGNAAYAQKKKKKKAEKKVEKKVEPKPEKTADDEEEEGEGEEDEEGVEESQETAAAATLQRGNRMEFDGRLIRGETAGSGAVFLFQRAPRALPSMVKTRTSYLGETVQEVLGDSGTEQFEKTKVEAMKEIEKEGKAKILKLQTEETK